MESAFGRAETAFFQTFLQRVFTWMVLGLAVTGIVAGIIGSSDSLLTSLTESPGILLVVVVAQLGLVLAISFGINRMSAATATVLFFLYAALRRRHLRARVRDLHDAVDLHDVPRSRRGCSATLAFIGAITEHRPVEARDDRSSRPWSG